MATIIEHFESVEDKFLKLQLLANLDMRVKDKSHQQVHVPGY